MACVVQGFLHNKNMNNILATLILYPLRMKHSDNKLVRTVFYIPGLMSQVIVLSIAAFWILFLIAVKYSVELACYLLKKLS